MSRRGTGLRAAAALGALALAAAGCAGADPEPAARGTAWQVTGVFDDPGLPTGPAEPAGAPVLVLGASSYTGSSPCGEFSGELDWPSDSLVRIRPPRVDATAPAATPCTDAIRVYDRRLRTVLPGTHEVRVRGGELRATAVPADDADDPAAGAGFAAVAEPPRAAD
ncbi:hypothetical protein CSPHI_10425 [Corynebacterium sphenisci DSM 44792]|uniref:DUF306 domain-containing protein n=1 Tax=Corynebacterium sphenisci DSM 44792 TaxID=1437874 RepID=A0A1L7CZX4_9CORY|nr:hypothetical protein [Corynebacterium sphenisci]APT91343.1 hypothetical protein CSPHI_10425 [Corynebacterium sphenisci DSM 44792]